MSGNFCCFLFLIVCVGSVGVGVGVGTSSGIKARGVPGAGVTSCREPSHMGAGNQSWIVSKSGWHSYCSGTHMQSHLSPHTHTPLLLFLKFYTWDLL